ncbi:nicotinate phosphoribosyltransferase [Tothia fuscella]|uniref:Nicotinate phosphoribosyltransferase n=1 Tax=Tothia fuscella TaxID=1048955 RepID=A0A9P4P5L7_9PEZI|nr:nicotinate phosphoribosyltransferase [Tothia fuscella]
MAETSSNELPSGITSLIDTDLYKLTMQCVVLKFYPDAHVTYSFTNRTPHKKFSRAAFEWLQQQIDKLASLRLSSAELEYLKKRCPYLSDAYLKYLSTFRMEPSKQVHMTFQPTENAGGEEEMGDIDLKIEGTWLETILYEIPLLALLSEAYFKFCDRDWNYDGQEDNAKEKGLKLLEAGCIFSEFGSRRRRDYHTQDTVLAGLKKAAEIANAKGWSGKLSGTSNVHFAMKHGLPPIGTVAHEWFMGVAAITNNYEGSNELALQHWVEMYGEGVLGIALTDTFGTHDFLRAFKKTVPGSGSKTYAQVFTGVRQDSGDPIGFAKNMREFYDEQGITEKKACVFSDSLNVDLCLEYKKAAEELGLAPSFGVGTFFTNDYKHISTGEKSVPLNIVIKISSANGRPAVKISDNIGKNTGDKATVAEVKRRLGYTEKEWEGGDESTRWGKDGTKP